MSEGLFWRSLSQWASGGSLLLGVACDIAIIVAVSTIVRRHRPDAYRGLQLWSILSLIGMVVLALARIVAPRFTVPDGIDAFVRTSVVLTIVGTLVHVALVVLLIRGLTALAQPPKPVVVEGTAPYR